MTAVVKLHHDYDAAPDAVWRVATDFAHFAEACRGLITFEGLPEGRAQAGQRIDVRFRLFGILPPQPYTMEVVSCDHAARRLQSRECGSGIRRWDHALSVDPHGAGARLTDRIEIDAGWLTPLFTAWARLLYRRRHPVRQRILASLQEA